MSDEVFTCQKCQHPRDVSLKTTLTTCPECKTIWVRIIGGWREHTPKADVPRPPSSLPVHGLYSKRVEKLMAETKDLHAEVQNSRILAHEALITTNTLAGKWRDAIDNAFGEGNMPPMNKAKDGGTWKVLAAAQRTLNETIRLEFEIMDRIEKDNKGDSIDDGPPTVTIDVEAE